MNFRDEIFTMEHPIFSLRGGDKKMRKYINFRNKSTIEIVPSRWGSATIFDKDMWIYITSKLIRDLDENKKIRRTISFVPHDFFRSTNRDSGGRSYVELKRTLSRLSGTRIEICQIGTNGKMNIVEFGLIDQWKIISKMDRKKGNFHSSKTISITIPEWLYERIVQHRVLQINKRYFSIRKAMERRLYEIARKHCGLQKKFTISLKRLHEKIGSHSCLNAFKHKIYSSSIQQKEERTLPDYVISIEKSTNQVTFRREGAENELLFSQIKKLEKKSEQSSRQKEEGRRKEGILEATF
ncbi:replication initiator protein A [Candidatus Riesia pediculicola]|uniref:replication initiator protein A n=1 Tax=Candidatus Riesia pediculicola TaxID=401619 RepID=UPI0009E39A6E|nr:replication initiator protein A [Candidatus Riesia pediculicola]